MTRPRPQGAKQAGSEPKPQDGGLVQHGAGGWPQDRGLVHRGAGGLALGNRDIGGAQPAGRGSESTDTTGTSHHVSSGPGSLGVGRGAGGTGQERLQLLCLPLTDAPWQRAARAGGGECPWRLLPWDHLSWTFGPCGSTLVLRPFCQGVQGDPTAQCSASAPAPPPRAGPPPSPPTPSGSLRPRRSHSWDLPDQPQAS